MHLLSPFSLNLPFYEHKRVPRTSNELKRHELEWFDRAEYKLSALL